MQGQAKHSSMQTVKPASLMKEFPTATYTAIHDSTGELTVAVADMSIFHLLSSERVKSLAGFIRSSRLVVVDGNLCEEAFSTLVSVATSYGVPVFFEPTSEHKCLLPVSTETLPMVCEPVL